MSFGTYETLLVSVDAAHIVTVQFNRPAVRNALNLAMVHELQRLLAALHHSPDVRAVVFTGAGDQAFVGGADIGELLTRDKYAALQFINNGVCRAIDKLPMPTVAAVRGFALGGGCEVALACDLRLAGHGAKFGQPEVTLGIIPGAGATYRLTRLVGPGWARELIYTGRVIDAAEAYAIGLVHRLCDDADVLPQAHALAQRIAQNSALAVRLAKLTLNAVPEMSVDAAMTLEASVQAVLFEDPEKQQRMQAFLQRRGAK